MKVRSNHSSITGFWIGLTGLTFLVGLRFVEHVATWLPYFLLSLSVTALLLWHYRTGARDRHPRPEQIFLDAAPDAAFTIDRRGLVTAWNHHAERTFGYDREEALGREFADLIAGDEARPSLIAAVRQCWSSEGSPAPRHRLDVIARHKQGGTIPIELTLLPMGDAERSALCLFARDTTDREEGEATLRRAREAAEEASRAKSDFLASVSHEIRTPLNAVCGTIDLLLATSLTPSQRQYGEMCAKAGHTLLRLVTDLLDFSRIEAGQIQVEQIPFDIHQVVERTVQLLAHRAEEKHLSLTCELSPEIPRYLEGDGFRLHQVLVNLLGNAIKFTDHGGIILRVTVERSAGEGERLRIAVRDSGIGIPSDQLERIFGRFTQVDAQARRQGGVGLGLAICKRLVHLMGGTIWAESDQEHGSTFTVDLPLKAVSEPESLGNQGLDRRASVLPSRPTAHPSGGRGLRVLVAEDSAESQQLLRFYFQHSPHQVRIVSNGEEAIAAFQAGLFDLVLLDLQMPGIDGLTAVRTIRAWESVHRHTSIPILALTANAYRDAEEQSLAAGCTGFLTKPITKSQLFEALQRYEVPPSEAPAQAEDSGLSLDLAARISREIQRQRPQFLAYRRQDVEFIRQAVAAQDYDAIRTIGHRMKGLSGSYGFPEIGAVGQRLEQAARSGDLAAIQQEIDHLETILADADQAA